MSERVRIQEKLLRDIDKQPIPNVTYGKSQYTMVKEDRQRIELSRGCPHGCKYCFEAKYAYAQKLKDVQQFPIPEIRKNHVEILDMNFLWQPNILDRIKELGRKRVNGKVVYYEEICGLDYRLITDEVAKALKESRFVNPRIAWDGVVNEQYQIKDTVRKLKAAGYRSEEIGVFMLVNHKIPYEECLKKLDILKVWNCRVCDCCYDGGYKNAIPEFWTADQIKDFRRRSRKHNQIVGFKLDPEIKVKNKNQTSVF